PRSFRSPRAPARPLVLLAILGAGLPGCGESEPDSAAMLLPESISDWVREDPTITYDRETIFDYINGAGEVYRSYAFSQVVVARYQRPGIDAFTVELFDMGNAEDAYGVFSYAREQEEMGIGGGFERRGSILCFWQDRYYVCVAAEERADDTGELLEEIARGVSEQLPPSGAPPPLVSMLPSDGLIPHSERFFHLHQTLNYNYYLVRENVLGLSPDTDVIMARYEPGSTYVVIIEYPDEGAAGAALSSFSEQILPEAGSAESVEREEGKFTTIAQQERFVVVVLDAVSESAADGLRQATLDNLR
ncbi:DUF6599 family protein, partial [Gemmatimonadota bacterium]